MRLLVNHEAEERSQLPVLIGLLKEHGLSGVATSKAYDYTDLQNTAEKARCEGILLINSGTLRNLLGEKCTLDAYRGTRINYPIPCIVANPIDHTHSVRHGRWLLSKDLEKFKLLKKPAQIFDFMVCDTNETLLQLLEAADEAVVISFDIETDEALRITCISFAILSPDGNIRCFLIPYFDFNVCHYGEDDAMHAMALATHRAVLDTPCPKLAFNNIYDGQYCIKYGAWPRNLVLDSMILAWAEYSELLRALDFVASLELYDYFQWKQESKEAKEHRDIRSYWAYCGKDSWNTLRVFISQVSRLTKRSHQLFQYHETLPLIYPSLYTAFEGILVDLPKHLELKAASKAKKEEALDKLAKMTAFPNFNPGSPKQVADLLYDTIGATQVEVFVKGVKTKSRSTDEKHLNKIAMQHPLLARIVGDIVDYRQSAKALSTYYIQEEGEESGLELMNDRLLYALDPSGTETGRQACKASSFYCGTQIQNTPPYAKAALVADEGFTLVERDKNKAEARCVGYLARSDAFIADIENPEKDFYKVVASKFFGIPYDEITPEIRNDITKHIIHGTHHMGGANQFINTVTPQKLFKAMQIFKIPLRNMEGFAKYLMELYHKQYVELKKNLWAQVQQEIRTTGKLVSPLGWTRICFGNIVKDHGVFRSGVAHMSQNLSVNILNREYYQTYLLCVASNGEMRLKAQIHDSILCQVKDEKLDHYLPMIMGLGDTTVEVYGRQMNIPSDIKIGKSWGEMKSWKL